MPWQAQPCLLYTSYDNVRVTEKDNGEGVITIYVEATTDKIPDVKPEGGSNSGFDVDVDGCLLYTSSL